jgi:hypothetical protein
MAGVDMCVMYCCPNEFVHAIGATDDADLVNLIVETLCAKIQVVGKENIIGVFKNYAGYREEKV